MLLHQSTQYGLEDPSVLFSAHSCFLVFRLFVFVASANLVRVASKIVVHPVHPDTVNTRSTVSLSKKRAAQNQKGKYQFAVQSQ